MIKTFFVKDNRNVELDRKKGGSPIESAEEEPIVRDWFHEALAKRGGQGQMAKQYEIKL